MDFQAMLKAEKARAKAESAATAAAAAAAFAGSQHLPVFNDLGGGIAICEAFLTDAEQRALTTSIDAIPTGDWAELTQRRLLNLGGVPHPSGSWSEPLPPDITSLCVARLTQLSAFPPEAPPDHVLLNEYHQGAGIDPHRDGPLFLPTAAIVSLEGDAVMEFFTEQQQQQQTGAAVASGSGVPSAGDACDGDDGALSGAMAARHPALVAVRSVLLRAGSCLVFRGEAYTTLRHGIADAAVDIVQPHCANARMPTALPAALPAALHAGASSPPVLSPEPLPVPSPGFAPAPAPAVGDRVARPPRRRSLTLRKLANVANAVGAFEVLGIEEEAERLRRRAWWLGSISEKPRPVG